MNIGILYTSMRYRTSDTKYKAMEVIMANQGVLYCCDVDFLPCNDREDEEETFLVVEDKEKEQIVEERWPVKPPQLDQQMHFNLQGLANDQSGHGQVDINEEDSDVEPLQASAHF